MNAARAVLRRKYMLGTDYVRGDRCGHCVFVRVFAGWLSAGQC